MAGNKIGYEPETEQYPQYTLKVPAGHGYSKSEITGNAKQIMRWLLENEMNVRTKS